MTRRDAKTLAWMGPLGLLLFCWWFFSSNPCLGAHIGNQWRHWFYEPPVVTRPANPAGPGDPFPEAEVAVNPYGIVSCDSWSRTPGSAITMVLFLVISGLIGFLAARHLEQRAAKRAALITGAILAIGFCITNFLYVPDLLLDIGFRAASIEIGGSLVILLLGAATSGAAARLTLRLWRVTGK